MDNHVDHDGAIRINRSNKMKGDHHTFKNSRKSNIIDATSILSCRRPDLSSSLPRVFCILLLEIKISDNKAAFMVNIYLKSD